MKFFERKIAILICFVFMLSIGFNNCTPLKSIKEDQSSLTTGDAGLNAFKSSPYTYITKNCSSCHATNQTPLIANPNINIAYASAKMKMNFINVGGSLLLLQSTNKHCKVDSCAKDPAIFKAMLENWKAAEFPSVLGSNSDVLETPGTRLRLVGRKFVAGKLKTLFGSEVSAITDVYIENEIGNFGGPCDRNLTDITFRLNGAQHQARIYPDCKSESDSQASVIGPTTPARFSLLQRACRKILQTDSYLNTGVMNALNTTTPQTSRAMTDADIQAIYSAFNIGKSPSLEVLSSLKKISDVTEEKGLAKIEAWRFVFLTLCLSPDWQIP